MSLLCRKNVTQHIKNILQKQITLLSNYAHLKVHFSYKQRSLKINLIDNIKKYIMIKKTIHFSIQKNIIFGQ